MEDLTRRSALKGGVGAALVAALGPFYAPPDAAAASATRVRVSKGAASGTPTTSLSATFPAPGPGNALVAVASIDGAAGTFTVPPGWSLGFAQSTRSVSIVAMTRVADGSETGARFAWSTPCPGGSWLTAEYSGLSTRDPIGPARVAPSSDTARRRMKVNPPAAEANSIVLALFAIDAMDSQASGDTGGVEFRPSGTGWRWVETSYDNRDGCPGTALTEYGTALTPGTDLAATTFSWRRLDQTAAGSLLLNLPSPRLTSRWVGAATATGATVAVKVTDASVARLKVATDQALTTDVAYSTPRSADGNGLLKLDVDGLKSATQYHYAVEVEGVLDAEKRGTLRTAPAGAGSFTLAFGSCCNSAPASIFTEIRDHDPDLFLHLGDLHYGNIATNDANAFRSRYDTALAAAPQGSLYANVPTAYVWSDHDFGGNASNGTSPSAPAAQAAYRDYVPSYPLPSSSGGIYQTFTFGRIRFILTDNRSHRSPRDLADTPDKTILGSEQKAWFKDVIASASEPVIIWGNETPWVGPPVANQDVWGSYNAERQELVAFVQSSGKNLAVISGDMHAVAVDDGTNSPGGMPVFHAAPFAGRSSHKGGPYTHGPIPATGVQVQQYGVIRVRDTGANVDLEFTGYAAGLKALVSYTKSYRS